MHTKEEKAEEGLKIEAKARQRIILPEGSSRVVLCKENMTAYIDQRRLNEYLKDQFVVFNFRTSFSQRTLNKQNTLS